MTPEELCAAAGVHPSYAETAKRYTVSVRADLMRMAADRLCRDRFAGSGTYVAHTVDDRLLGAALRTLADRDVL